MPSLGFILLVTLYMVGLLWRACSVTANSRA